MKHKVLTHNIAFCLSNKRQGYVLSRELLKDLYDSLEDNTISFVLYVKQRGD